MIKWERKIYYQQTIKKLFKISNILKKEREDDYHAKGIIQIMLILQEISKWRKELYINVGNINPDI